jgi:molybdopterin-guanine dinucleotide biosynthesis protein A
MPPGAHDLHDVALAVLAGGEGSRMGYAKAEIRLRGRPILDVLLEQFAWSGPTLLVTAPGREHPTGWRAFTKEVADPTAGEGPLRGVLTALEHSPAPIVLVTAVDMPGVRHEQLRWLAAAMRDARDARGAVGVMPRQAGMVQPLPSAFSAPSVPLIRRAMAAGRRALHGLAKEAEFAVLDVPADWPAATWTNLNSPQDIDAAGG